MIKVVLAVFVGALLDVEEQLVVVMLVGAEELVLFRDAIIDLYAQDGGCFEGPAARYVLYGVSAATQNDCGNSEFQHVVHTGSMAADR